MWTPLHKSLSFLHLSMRQAFYALHCVIVSVFVNQQAISWIAKQSSISVQQQRQNMIDQIERAGDAMWNSGLRDQWFKDADANTRHITKHVNAALFESLLKESGYCDVECVELFRKGEWFRSSSAFASLVRCGSDRCSSGW